MSTKIEIDQISTYELEQLVRRATREELQAAFGNSNHVDSNYSDNNELIPRAKFLEITGKSESWLSKNMANGTIPFHRIGRSIFFRMNEVLERAKKNLKITKKSSRREI